jgi:hypothetical protein
LKDLNVPWTLTLQPPPESIRLDNHLLAVGKATCLAANLECNCKVVLNIIAFIKTHEKEKNWDAAAELVLALSANAKMLGATIRQIEKFSASSPISASDLETLRAATASRNYIAHQAAAVGPLHCVEAQMIEDRFARLLSHVEILAAGESLAAKWCFEIEEKEPAPRDFQKEYVKRVKSGWVSKRGSGVSR